MAWKLYEGDCFDYFHLFEDKSVDMILCDLPYGTTACKWDTPLPLDRLWKEYKRLIKDNGAIVLTGSQPFTSKLVMSNPEMFRYEWIWEKSRSTNFLDANRKPLKKHENILIFGVKNPNYYPIMEIGTPYVKKQLTNGKTDIHAGFFDREGTININKGTRFPNSIISFSNSNNNNVHPTQKPVKLFQYLIRTYTNENDLVLDNCAGSGTTGVACEITNRNSILIEKEPKYCEIIRERLSDINMEEYQPQRVHKPLTAF